MAIQAAIAAAVLWSYARQYPADQNFLAASIDKQALVRTQATPRLILVGGSSLPMGVNSARIAAACRRRPVNMGLHAGLGLKFMLREIEPHLRAGDWIVLAPEYQQFLHMDGQSELLVNMIEINPANARLLDASQWAAVFDRGAVQRFGKIARAVLGRPGRFFRKNVIGRTRLYYRRAGFNATGDMVAHLRAKSPGMEERNFTFRYREKEAHETIAAINAFARRAQARGGRVFFSHPPLPQSVFEANRARFEPLENALRAGLSIPLLDRAGEVTFPIEDFFDTWYHLAGSGVEKRSALLASRLGAVSESVSQ